MSSRSYDGDEREHGVQLTRRAALVGTGSLAAAGGLLAATKGFATAPPSPVPMRMLPATVARVHDGATADIVPLGTNVTLETEVAGTDELADFSHYDKNAHVLVVTSNDLPLADSYRHGDPRRLPASISADMVVPLTLGSIEALADR